MSGSESSSSTSIINNYSIWVSFPLKACNDCLSELIDLHDITTAHELGSKVIYYAGFTDVVFSVIQKKKVIKVTFRFRLYQLVHERTEDLV